MSQPLPSQYDIATMSHLQYNAATVSAPVNHHGYNEDTMNANDLAAKTAGVKIDNFNWLQSTNKVEKVKGLKELCVGNCRLLYGSERFKFYGNSSPSVPRKPHHHHHPIPHTLTWTKDVVICNDEASKRYCAILTCNQDGQTKFLRTVSGMDPVLAVRELVDGLQKDTSKLFCKTLSPSPSSELLPYDERIDKYAVGSQLEGQQGYTNPMTGQFELSITAVDRKIQGPVDDTAGLIKSWTHAPGGAPRGPRGYKRRAEGQMDRPQAEQQMYGPQVQQQMYGPQTEQQMYGPKAENTLNYG
ncbi:hypothetical protein yc1106_00478 [Curvularia clavata]|uniref:Uncharacterized protein n=1 Tax=Curvularia clavata TaxID=95742 RepID=A0A9Q8Z1P2_CURCL|nr:hypothetical protein yc1106_00478 [Curvularia clavata]